MILMLDFDGVLHPEPCSDKALLLSCTPILEDTLREFAFVKIVVTSTWRETRSVEQLKQFFSSDIAPRVIGVTPSWRDHEDLADRIGPTYFRSIEIEAWLRTRGEPWLPWIALDDKPQLYRPFCKSLITCNPATGISTKEVTLLRRYFLENC